MTPDDIRAAADRIEGWAIRTPLLSSPALDRLAGRRVLVKPECLQKTGSFKYRGAKAAITALPAGTDGVVAVSSGNHAQGVALAAAEAGRTAAIVMPADAPRAKIEGTRDLGAEVVPYDRATQDRDAIAADLAARRGLAFIPPFDHEAIIAGQGTVGVEIAADAAAAGVRKADVLVCCGGGGLSAGIAAAFGAAAPDLRVRPVEPENFDDVARSLAAGEICRNKRQSGSICDALLTPAPGALTFPILAERAGPGLVVTDAEALRAMAAAFHTLRVVAEPGGAVALAAALYRADEVPGDAVIVVISGGNVDPIRYCAALCAYG